MFKSWSIKRLLQLWSLTTVLAIMVIATIAIYTNNIFSDSQNKLINKVLPIERAANKINSVAFLLLTRQKQIIASHSVEEIEQLAPRERIEQAFSLQWNKISASVDGKQDKDIVNALQGSYQQFLKIDEQLVDLIIGQHTIRHKLQKKIDSVELLDQQIQNTMEAISGRIRLQQVLEQRERRFSAKSYPAATNDYAKKEQNSIQKLSQSIQLHVLQISYLTQKLLQEKNTDNLLSIRDNNIHQHNTILKVDIKQLSAKLKGDKNLLSLTQDLERSETALFDIVTDGETSIYTLKLQQLKNNTLLYDGQKNAIEILKQITTELNTLSSLTKKKSMKAVDKALSVSKQAQWIIITLSIFVTLGMIGFIMAISQRINEPLATLRKAMHTLSIGQFDTHLEVNTGKSEFALLAADFNLFAGNTQILIDDLAEAKDSIQKREQQIAAILNSVPEAILTLTSSGVIESSNPAAESVLKASEKLLIGMKLNDFFAEKYKQASLTDIRHILSESKEFDGQDYNKQAFSMWLSLNQISGFKDELWVCVISDITAWKQAEQNLKITSSELDAILENAVVGIAFIKDRHLFRVNQKFEQIFGYDRATIEGQSTRCLYPSDEIYNQLGEDGYEALSLGDSYESEIRLIRQDGSQFWGMMSGKAIDANNIEMGSIWLFEDITLQREKDEKLRQLATLDSLTGLPNRGVFNDRLEHAIHKANRNSTRLAVFFLDLDHFKHINDSLGHKAGDLLLCDVAERLKICIRGGDTVARLGGDEFTIILEEVRSAQHVAKVAEKVLESIIQPYMLDNTEVSISPSIGISLYPADGRDVDLLVRNADAAMYHAKENGRNNFQFYSAEMNAQAAKRLAMETSLRRAIEHNEFYLHYQPQIDLDTGRVLGAEALLRWHSEQWGNVSPVEFVPILEDTGLIAEVGETVIKQAIQAYLLLKDKLEPEFKMAVNLSGRQFQGGQLASFVEQQLVETGMSPNNLELEITETILMDDSDLAISTLNSLSELGITLTIDDFGTGYSSLSYLKRFPLNVLKIDRSFVRDINTDVDDAAIVDAILAMSRRLKFKVVAEGVETAEQLKFLQEKGCDYVQGYFFSKPLSLGDFAQFIENCPNSLMPK